MHDTPRWPARRILGELCDAPRRQRILEAFWKNAEPHARQLAVMQLAKSMHFREETIRKATAAKKAEWLASRAGAPEMHEAIEMGLMAYHTTAAKEMLAAFLDAWSIPHSDGTIEVDDYRAPSVDEVRKAANDLAARFDKRDIAVYLASAGLLMGPDWAEATWPVVDEMAPQQAGG